jgi:hypothetical protein
MRPTDTSPEAWRIFLDGLLQMSPAQKMQRALELSETVRSAAEAGLRQRFPQADDRQIFLRLARLVLGAELARKVYGDVLTDERPAGERA